MPHQFQRHADCPLLSLRRITLDARDAPTRSLFDGGGASRTRDNIITDCEHLRITSPDGTDRGAGSRLCVLLVAIYEADGVTVLDIATAPEPAAWAFSLVAVIPPCAQSRSAEFKGRSRMYPDQAPKTSTSSSNECAPRILYPGCFRRAILVPRSQFKNFQ
jgi:hypothetical protein